MYLQWIEGCRARLPDGMIASLHGMESARVVKEQVSKWTVSICASLKRVFNV